MILVSELSCLFLTRSRKPEHKKPLAARRNAMQIGVAKGIVSLASGIACKSWGLAVGMVLVTPTDSANGVLSSEEVKL